jgi:hypothetical protein
MNDYLPIPPSNDMQMKAELLSAPIVRIMVDSLTLDFSRQSRIATRKSHTAPLELIIKMGLSKEESKS